MTTTMSSKGQIVLPAQLRQIDRIQAGQPFDIERLDAGVYRLTRRPAGTDPQLIDWLLNCPSKGYFVAVESESTETL